MNIEIFKEVSRRNENGEVVGILASTKPEYKQEIRDLKIKFINLVKNLQIDNLKAIGLDERYLSSGYYKKYFWGKLIFNDEYSYKDIAIWVGLGENGLSVYLGISDEFSIDRNIIREYFISKIDYTKTFDNFIFDNNNNFIRYKYTSNLNNINIDNIIDLIKYLRPIYREALDYFIFKGKFNTQEKLKIKNIILYGSVGVGKTHNYQNIISMIEQNRPQKEIFDTIVNSQYVELNKDIFISVKNEKRVEFVTFHQSYSYEDFIEGYRPNADGKIERKDGIFKTLCEQAIENQQQNYYIVIDEINRGNISKIFGELITLVEEDKRDTYEVTLPYSKKPFIVPLNLYIIATMNSTDKSIATIDIALRRRFIFLKMKPSLELVKNQNAKDMMKKLNVYITNHLGEDYQLGHSYFMKVQNDEDLKFVIDYKIKPLLEEYFYVDNKSVDEILKEALENNNE